MSHTCAFARVEQLVALGGPRREGAPRTAGWVRHARTTADISRRQKLHVEAATAGPGVVAAPRCRQANRRHQGTGHRHVTAIRWTRPAHTTSPQDGRPSRRDSQTTVEARLTTFRRERSRPRLRLPAQSRAAFFTAASPTSAVMRRELLGCFDDAWRSQARRGPPWRRPRSRTPRRAGPASCHPARAAGAGTSSA